MTAPIKLTPAQDRVLRLTAVHGMRRRTGWGAPIHWAGIHTFRPQPVTRLFGLRFLRVVKLGVEDMIEVSEAGSAYLAEHPEPKS